MAIVINGGLDIRWPAVADLRFGPWLSTAAAIAGIPQSRRAVGLMIMITGGALYWWKDDITDGGLVPFSAAAAPYKEYAATISQAGGGAPFATVVNNTLGGAIVWTRFSAGIYRGELVGAFTDGKTFISTEVRRLWNSSATYRLTQEDEDTIQLLTHDGSALADNVINGAVPIEVRVYP